MPENTEPSSTVTGDLVEAIVRNCLARSNYYARPHGGGSKRITHGRICDIRMAEHPTGGRTVATGMNELSIEFTLVFTSDDGSGWAEQFTLKDDRSLATVLSDVAEGHSFAF